MTEEIRNQMMSYLYNEMDPDQKEEFEKKLAEDEELQGELNELNKTSRLIESVPSEVPPHKMIMLMPGAGRYEDEGQGSSSTRNSKSRGIFKYPAAASILAVAASILIIVVSGAAMGLQFGHNESGYYLNFGKTKQTEEETFTKDEVYALMEQMQQENSVLLATMFDQLQERQEEQLTEAVGVMTNYVQQQRQEDLQLISRSLIQLQENTYNRFRQTDETLGDLIYAISYQQNQPIEE